MSILTLSGWTQPTDAIARALAPNAATFDYSDYASAEASFEALEQYRDVDAIIAWSLGGQLVLRAIAAGVLKPNHLTLIAAPYQFVRSSGGMDPTTYEQFRTNYAADPARTKGRFHALLAKGDREMRRILPLLGHHHEVENTERWLPWFDELGRVNLADLDLSNLPPTLVIHGENDAIVPVAQSELLTAHVPHITLERWDGVAHAPHLHDASRLQDAIVRHRMAA